MAKKKAQGSNLLEVQNTAKTMFANIRFMSVDKPLKTIAMTSSVPNEGKSTTTVELAKAIASSGKKALLVEADMRRRSLAAMLGVRAQAGVYAVLSDQATLAQAIVATKTPNLYFLDSEPNIPNPADIISSKRYKKLVGTLEESYDYVLFDTPPVGTFVDAAVLSTLVDGTIMVVKPGSTNRAELVGAYEQLKKADANVIGVCATHVEGTGSEYYYEYYTKGGERTKSKKGRSSRGSSSEASASIVPASANPAAARSSYRAATAATASKKGRR